MTSRSTDWSGYALALLLAIGLGLRLHQIGDQILLDDELHAVAKLATADYAGILHSFGGVDHSIPLTLFFKWVAEKGRLSEAWMLAPSMVFGIGAWLLCVAMARRVATPLATVTFAALLSISPLLVMYTRQARPYAITLFLVLAALWAAFRWTEEGKIRHAAIYVFGAVLAVYLHLIVAPITLGVWLFFLGEWLVVDRRDRRVLLRIVAIAAVTMALLAFLLLPPMLNDWQALGAKVGQDRPTLETAVRMLWLMHGTAWPLLGAAMTLFAAVGTAVLWRSHPRPTRFVLTMIAMQAVAVSLSGAQWLSQQLVLSRYLLVALPFLIFATAVGFAWCCSVSLGRPQRPGRGRGLVGAALAGILVTLCLISGPLPSALGRPNAFFEHQMYFLDFDPAHNVELPYLRAGAIPPFYRELARMPPSSRVIIEAPWRFESMFNRLAVYQEIHHQRVKIGMVGGLCPPGAYAEQPRTFPNKFRHFIDLARPVDELRHAADYIVFHKALDMANMTEPWQRYDGRGLPPVDACIETFRRSLGSPVFDDDTLTVFALKPQS